MSTQRHRRLVVHYAARPLALALAMASAGAYAASASSGTGSLPRTTPAVALNFSIRSTNSCSSASAMVLGPRRAAPPRKSASP